MLLVIIPAEAKGAILLISVVHISFFSMLSKRRGDIRRAEKFSWFKVVKKPIKPKVRNIRNAVKVKRKVSLKR